MGDYNLVNEQNLTEDQVAQLLLQNGFTPQQAAQMVAIQLNEDPQGNPGIVNDTPATGDYSVGLWQINYYDGLYKSRAAEFGTPTALAADPASQAAAAHQLFQQSGYNPWLADFNNGTAEANLPAGVQAVNDVLGGHVQGGPVNETAATSAISNSVGNPALSGAFGSFLASLDAFFNPNVKPAGSLPLIGPIANGTASAIVQAIDRGLGIVFGIGLVYIGIKMFGGQGGTTVNIAAPVSRAFYGARTAAAQDARTQALRENASRREATARYKEDARERQQAAKNATSAFVASQRVEQARVNAHKTYTYKHEKKSTIHHTSDKRTVTNA